MSVDAEVLAGIGIKLISNMEKDEEKDISISIANDSLPNLKDMYDRYYSERDKQISFFWEHSKYIWTFIALCFGGFGFLIQDYLFPSSEYNNLFVNSLSSELENRQIMLYASLSGIAFLGMLSSTYLLWMIKGCKAWYEVFEIAIWTIETKDKKFNIDDHYRVSNFWQLKNSTEFFRPFKSAPYSHSKVNILIAYTLIIVWMVLLYCFATKLKLYSFNLFCLLILVYVLIVCFRKIMIGSSELDLKSKIKKQLKKTHYIKCGFCDCSISSAYHCCERGYYRDCIVLSFPYSFPLKGNRDYIRNHIKDLGIDLEVQFKFNCKFCIIIENLISFLFG